MSKRPRESTSSRLRRTRLPASSAARGADSSSTRASTPSPTGKSEQPDPAQRGGAVVVEQVVGGVDRLVEADGGHRVAQPDQRRLHGDLLDEEREAAGGPQQAAYLVGLRVEVDLLAARGPDPAQEQLHGRRPRGASGGTAPAAGRPARRTRTAGRRWSARSPRPGRRSCSPAPPGASGRPRWRRGRGRRAPAGTRGRRRRAPGRRRGSRRGRSRRRGSAGRRRAGRRGVRRSRASTHDVSRPGRDVAHDERLAAAGRADDGDPARLVERVAQRALDVVTTQARRQHGSNLSLLAAGD